MKSPSHAKTPLSRHPAFPAIVALWFAVLSGVGSLFLRTGTLENAVLALHVDALVPAAAPPLGFTARLLLALLLALAGGVLGFFVARRVAEPGAAAPRRRAEPAAPQADTATLANEEEEGEDLSRLAAAREALPLRRRGLTSEAENAAPEAVDDPFAELPPAPGILSIGDLGALDSPQPAAVVPAESEAPVALPFASAPAPAPTPAPALALPEAPLETLAIPQLVERLALALAARRARALSEAPAMEAPGIEAPEIEALEVEAPEPAVAPAALPPPPFAAAGTQGDAAPPARPFDMPAAMRAPAPGAIEWFDEEEEQATLDSLLPPKRPRSEPALAVPADLTAADEDEDAAADEAAADEDLPSLLAMKNPARPGFVRVEDEAAPEMPEPVVVLPGQGAAEAPARAPTRLFGRPAPAPAPAPVSAPAPAATPAAPAETEAALREALATLQRMSGAA